MAGSMTVLRACLVTVLAKSSNRTTYEIKCGSVGFYSLNHKTNTLIFAVTCLLYDIHYKGTCNHLTCCPCLQDQYPIHGWFCAIYLYVKPYIVLK